MRVGAFGRQGERLAMREDLVAEREAHAQLLEPLLVEEGVELLGAVRA